MATNTPPEYALLCCCLQHLQHLRNAAIFADVGLTAPQHCCHHCCSLPGHWQVLLDSADGQALLILAVIGLLSHGASLGLVLSSCWLVLPLLADLLLQVRLSVLKREEEQLTREDERLQQDKMRHLR
jgi:hypothetical protein